MDHPVPPWFVRVSKDQFDDLLSRVNWFRDGWGSTLSYRYVHDRREFAIHRETDDTFWINPRNIW
jgi:hypothetical protein